MGRSAPWTFRFLSRAPIHGTFRVQGTVRREELGPGGGERRFRLFFEPPITGHSLLTFRYKTSVDPAMASPEAKCVIKPIVVSGCASGSTTVNLSCEPDVEVAALDPAWIALRGEPPGKSADDSLRRYQLKTGARPDQGLSLSIRRLSQAAMPAIVAPRALLRTVIGLGDETRTQAWYWIESHPTHVSFSLPDQASWVLCRIDGRPVAPLRTDASGSTYRLNLASESRSSPVLVELEYKQSGAQARRACSPPDLLEGAVVLQTLWEVAHSLEPWPHRLAIGSGSMKMNGIGMFMYGSGDRGLPLPSWWAGCRARRRRRAGSPSPWPTNKTIRTRTSSAARGGRFP